MIDHYTVETVGRLLFGSGLRFELAAWLVRRPDPVFYADQFHHETGRYASTLSQVCARLASLGMLERLPEDRNSRVKLWKRTNSPLWDVVQVAVEITEDQPKERKPYSERQFRDATEKLRGIEAALR